MARGSKKPETSKQKRTTRKAKASAKPRAKKSAEPAAGSMSEEAEDQKMGGAMKQGGKRGES